MIFIIHQSSVNSPRKKSSVDRFELPRKEGIQSAVHGHGITSSPQLLVQPPPLYSHHHPAQLNASTSVSNPPTILQDLERCSEVMGISEESLSSKRKDLMEVGRRAQLFLDSIQSLLPSEFSIEHRNPCWMAEQPKAKLSWNKLLKTFFQHNSRELRLRENKNSSHYLSKPLRVGDSRKGLLLCLPYFFLAGFPKSATTTVHEALRKLPQVAAPQGKEPHWWTRVLGLSDSLQDLNIEQLHIAFMAYTRFFGGRKEWSADTITYDGSQSTLWDSNFLYKGQDYCAMPAVMSRVLPDAKFIVVLRNPATRLHSHFLFSCKLHYGRQQQQWPQAVIEQGKELFHSQVEKDIDSFNQCTETMSEFECASIWTSTRSKTESVHSSELCGLVWHRLTIGMYIVHIKKWLQFYPLENFLFIKMEDISDDSAGTILRITQFLNIPPLPRETAESIFGQPQNALNMSKSQPMDESTKVLLERFYQPFNEELAKTLNDERFLWAS